MAEHAGKPKVRFAGFTEAWEQRKLGEIADIVGGGTPSTNNPSYWNGDIDWYAPAEIGEQIFLTGSQKKITVLGLQKSSATILPVGSVLFTSRAGIGNTAILAKQGATNQGFQSIVPDSKIADSYFIFSRTHELKKYAETVGAGSTFTEVSGKQMARMPILMPKIDEQVRIGTFFRHLDRLITLHQRKRGRLENIKKAMLEKMFPKNGADVPEVRFAGFTEAWEQRKLGELGSVAMCKRIFKDQTSEEGDVPFYKIGTFGEEPDAYISRELFDEYKSKYPYPDKGTILISASGSIGRVVEFAGKDEYFQDSNIVWLKHDKRIADTFLKYIYEVISWAGIEGSTIKRLYNDNMLKTEVKLPCIDEQEHIGRFFRHLDRLVTLHQRKVALLQNIKKACLEKMFV